MNRSEVRYACARAKNGNATSDLQPILDKVEPLLESHQRWENFKRVWDILVDKQGNIVIIAPETNYDFVHSTCLEASFLTKKKLGFGDLNTRQLNIVTIVEASMLDNLMSWENYSTAWGVDIDQDMKAIRTKMYNKPSNQTDVTDEMIEASKKAPMGIVEQVGMEPLRLVAEPMTDEQIKTFNKMLKSKSKKKGK